MLIAEVQLQGLTVWGGDPIAIFRGTGDDGELARALQGRAGATSDLGRGLQTLLARGGISFPTVAELNRRCRAAGLRLTAQWSYRVVVFSQFVPAGNKVQ